MQRIGIFRIWNAREPCAIVPKYDIIWNLKLLTSNHGHFSLKREGPFLVKPKRPGVLFSAEHSSWGNPRLAVACGFSGDSARCAPQSLIVVSDLSQEHPYLPSSALAVSAHLHVHGREAPRSTGRTGQWTTEWLVELKLDGVDIGRATTWNSIGRDIGSGTVWCFTVEDLRDGGDVQMWDDSQSPWRTLLKRSSCACWEPSLSSGERVGRDTRESVHYARNRENTGDGLGDGKSCHHVQAVMR